MDKSKFDREKDSKGNSGYKNKEDGSWWVRDKAKHETKMVGKDIQAKKIMKKIPKKKEE